MIDWRLLLANALWILGFSILLAGFSFHYWTAAQKSLSVKNQLQTTTFTILLWIACTLISLGFAGTSSRIWEMLIWLLFAAISLFQLFRLWLNYRINLNDRE